MEGDKKSVIKKVKDKAFKIKDTIKKYGHRHGHEHDEDNDDDIMVPHDHEVHGGQIIESTVIKSKNIPRDQTNLNSEKPTNTKEDQYGRNVSGQQVTRQSDQGQKGPESKARSAQDENNPPDKGVSMREYLSEKFRPGPEDKALSDVITNAFHKKKGGSWASGDESAGRGVVDRVKDAVGSWLGMSSTGMETIRLAGHVMMSF